MTEHDTDTCDNGADPAEVQQRLAEERTVMALQRTVLSNERTLNSWLRTGLATMAAGFTIGLLLGQEGVLGPARIFGAALIATGGLICIVGLVRYRSLRSRLEPENVSSVPVWLLETLVAFFILVAFVGALVLLRG